MENKVKDIDSVDYLNNDNKKSFFWKNEIREFFTDEELAEQFEELKS